jgi:hypothetical protein
MGAHRACSEAGISALARVSVGALAGRTLKQGRSSRGHWRGSSALPVMPDPALAKLGGPPATQDHENGVRFRSDAVVVVAAKKDNCRSLGPLTPLRGAPSGRPLGMTPSRQCRFWGDGPAIFRAGPSTPQVQRTAPAPLRMTAQLFIHHLQDGPMSIQPEEAEFDATTGRVRPSNPLERRAGQFAGWMFRTN